MEGFRRQTRETAGTTGKPPTKQPPTKQPPTGSHPANKGGKTRTGIGARLLKRMGWKEGEGLGRDSDGRKDPVEASNKMNGDMRGLGYTHKGRDARRAGKRRRTDGNSGKGQDQGGDHETDPLDPASHRAGQGQGAFEPFEKPRFMTESSCVIRRGMQVWCDLMSPW